MRFGLEPPPEANLRELVEIGKAAEEASFDSIWLSDLLSKVELWSGVAALVLNTERLAVGTDVTNPFTRHPAVTAQALLTLQEASGGRVILGMGSGMPEILRKLGVERRDLRGVCEAMRIIRSLLSGEEVRFEGEHFRISGFKLPFARKEELAILGAALSPEEAEILSSEADGIITISAHPGFLKALKRGRLVVWAPLALREDESAALKILRERWGLILAQIISSLPQSSLELLGLEGERERAREALSSRDPSLLSERAFESLALFGGGEEVRRKIGELERAGADELIFPIAGRGEIERISEEIARRR